MEENKKVIIAGAAVILLVVLAVLVYFLFFAGKSAEEPIPTEALQEQAELESTEEVVTPGDSVETIDVALDESDETVRDLVKLLSSNPELAKWLMTKDIIRKFTATVDNIANGESPRPHIDFYSPSEKFKIEFKSGAAYIHPASYDRYNTVADVVDSLDTLGCIRLFKQMKPSFQEAYSELGYPDRDFGKTLEKAITALLEVPVPTEDVEVKQKVLTYMFVDERYERLTNAQKHLFRMGPRNVRMLQEKLKEFAVGFGMEP